MGRKYFQPFKIKEITGSCIVAAEHAHMCDDVLKNINKQSNTYIHTVFQKFDI